MSPISYDIIRVDCSLENLLPIASIAYGWKLVGAMTWIAAGAGLGWVGCCWGWSKGLMVGGWDG